MNPNISKAISGTIIPTGLNVYGEWDVKVTRADGSVEEKTLKNAVTAYGMNRIANRAVQATGTTPFYCLAVGTATAAPADTDGPTSVGECVGGRKQSTNTGASAQSREWIFLTATYAGATDGLTGIDLASAAICDLPTSSAITGGIANRVNSLAVTLAASDFLSLTVRFRVGSHNQAHST
ncbi:hypothetical protein UFOVP1082_55 [uncultured Caudovirales phage]|uniref:Uncharacterized protein n=1 Tax=uncultured Caudovirales phage TaxID=2100421 RepID=A0A6J5SDM4_9CAUD|nr:hypothetical protein UFOVP906_33 [uncultured Caudovirales phage]CAB4176756.1 hypothetical protein UFOVP992_59 [uncultured Caudovirales phage]CAB4183458.1 hypothetical protein UFOVP1082_55 [uncultured Caudovirales phage]CAB4197769.1 hypothetical protein UFOVP1322_40 [uncultured Caudovirales phage]CAB4212270.1 hypothetical protein UFOVP1434_3 [uncultured Caudovirales phage]